MTYVTTCANFSSTVSRSNVFDTRKYSTSLSLICTGFSCAFPVIFDDYSIVVISTHDFCFQQNSSGLDTRKIWTIYKIALSPSTQFIVITSVYGAIIFDDFIVLCVIP